MIGLQIPLYAIKLLANFLYMGDQTPYLMLLTTLYVKWLSKNTRGIPEQTCRVNFIFLNR